MPSFFIRVINVVRYSPMRAAAPFAPDTAIGVSHHQNYCVLLVEPGFSLPSLCRLGRWIVTTAVSVAVLAESAISAQDKYTVKVPGGLAFSEFRGYEGWQATSISRNEKVVAMILGNPVMIDAYRAGIPGNGEPVPDGARMAKIHWVPKQSQFFPETTVPGNLLNVDFMEKDSNPFADCGG